MTFKTAQRRKNNGLNLQHFWFMAVWPFLLFGCQAVDIEKPSMQAEEGKTSLVAEGGVSEENKAVRPKRNYRAKLKCDDGQKYTLTFSKDQNTARLISADKKIKEVLEDKHIGTGISYGNERFVYEEHGKDIKIIRINDGEEKTVLCKAKTL